MYPLLKNTRQIGYFAWDTYRRIPSAILHFFAWDRLGYFYTIPRPSHDLQSHIFIRLLNYSSQFFLSELIISPKRNSLQTFSDPEQWRSEIKESLHDCSRWCNNSIPACRNSRNRFLTWWYWMERSAIFFWTSSKAAWSSFSCSLSFLSNSSKWRQRAWTILRLPALIDKLFRWGFSRFVALRYEYCSS